MARKSRESWNKSSIDEAKKLVKVELDQVLQQSGEAERLNYILDQVQLLEPTDESAPMLRRFIFIMSALVHHERFGGLGKKQIHDLSILGQAILRVAGVKPGHSSISFLYSELHSIMSDIHFSNGEFLPSLWERLLGSHMAVMPPEHLARQNLGVGINALRLGNSILALDFFERGLSETQEPKTLDRLGVYRVKTLRVSGNLSRAKELTFELMASLSDPSCVQELNWEKACMEASASNDLSGLFELARKGQPHYASSYLLELFFWSYAHPKTQWSKRLLKLSTLAGQKGLDFQRNSGLFALAQSLEQAYDTDVPFAKRLADIKRVLAKIEVLRNVDQSLLVWLALARWLHRSHHQQMAGIIFHEYMSLSQKLSSGRSLDVLGLAADLLKVDWLQRSG